MLVIVNAVKHNVLTTKQGASLCDLYAKGNEFVVAAWEVFILERDVSDFMDTLLRVLIKVCMCIQLASFCTFSEPPLNPSVSSFVLV